MKTLRALLLCSVACVLLFAVSAQAQTAQLPIRVNVPFAFQVGATTFAPGSYQIFVDTGRLHIVNAGTSERRVFVMNSAVRTKHDPSSALQFVKRDGKYILKKVWVGGVDTGMEMILSN